VRRLPNFVFVPGVALIVFGSGLAHARYSVPSYRYGSQNSMWAYGALALWHTFVGHAVGLPDEARETQPAAAAAAVSSAVATGSWLLIQTVQPGLLPRWVILISAVLVPFYMFLTSWISVIIRRREQRRERVMAIMGDDDLDRFAVDSNTLFPGKEREFVVACSVGIDRVSRLDRGAVTLNELSEDHPLAAFGDVSTLVLSEGAAHRDDVFAIAEALHQKGVKVWTLRDFYEHHFGKLPVSELSRMALLFDIQDIHDPTFRHLKRAVDVCGGVVAALLCTIVTPFILLGNVIANRGPLLYSQRRVGRSGKQFTILKFRTMRPHAGDADTPWTTIEDPRVTPFGRLLRRAHLDELPQAVNILRGELSLVGPRPEQPQIVSELIAKEPAFALRHLVTPGLTGWAQVKYRYASTEAAAMEKLQYDLYYVSNQSLSLDLRILSRTVRSVARRRGR
jgi:lipopolysaccharide/colanic/teichoic acid biosynthesis glycosyltransferase